MAGKPKAFKKNIPGISPQAHWAALRTDLAKTYRAVRSGEAEAIHQARVKARRWAIACKLLQDSLGRKNAARLAQMVRRPAKNLAKVRALDVCLVLAASRWGLKAPDHWLIRFLVQARKRHWLHARVYFFPMKLKKLFGKMETEISSLRPSGNVREILGRSERSWKRRYFRVKANPSAKRWHKLRIATKKWRYALEAAASLTLPVSSRTKIATLKKLQSTLGSAHDEEILRQYIQQAATDQAASIRRQAKSWDKDLAKTIRQTLLRATKIAIKVYER